MLVVSAPRSFNKKEFFFFAKKDGHFSTKLLEIVLVGVSECLVRWEDLVSPRPDGEKEMDREPVFNNELLGHLMIFCPR